MPAVMVDVDLQSSSAYSDIPATAVEEYGRRHFRVQYSIRDETDAAAKSIVGA